MAKIVKKAAKRGKKVTKEISKIVEGSPAHIFIELITKNDVRLRNIQYEAPKELLKKIGKVETVYEDDKKDDLDCIETTIIHFKDSNLYLKEVAVGECHYRDVAIDGEIDSLEYFLVEPKEIVRIDYVETAKYQTSK